jgi:hypothetical protein
VRRFEVREVRARKLAQLALIDVSALHKEGAAKSEN